MKHSAALTNLAHCPKCGGELEVSQEKNLSCKECSTVYPELGGIPWLYSDSQYVQADWKNRFDYFLQLNQTEIQRLKLEQLGDHLLESTKKRLSKLIQAKVEHGKEVAKAIAPIVSNDAGDPAIHQATGTKLPNTQALMSYYDNICRDWSYGDEENLACLNTIKGVLNTQDLGTLGVLGSGACRLAYDIHTELNVENTINVDINPFLFFVAQRLIDGKSVNLYEFPMAPKNMESTAIKLKCKAPQPLKDNFHFVLSDAMNPSFRDGAFDTLLTPWLIDIVHQDIRQQFKRYNRITKMGGRWINFGSLSFFHSLTSICYSLEETLEIVAEAGFEVENYSHEEIPYLHSPYSNQKRMERVLCFSAKKVKEIDQPQEGFSYQAKWLENIDKPIPLSQGIQQQTMVHSTLKELFALVDGKRSLRDIAKAADFLGVPEDNAILIVKNVLEKYFDDSLQGRQF